MLSIATTLNDKSEVPKYKPNLNSAVVSLSVGFVISTVASTEVVQPVSAIIVGGKIKLLDKFILGASSLFDFLLHADNKISTRGTISAVNFFIVIKIK